MELNRENTEIKLQLLDMGRLFVQSKNYETLILQYASSAQRRVFRNGSINSRSELKECRPSRTVNNKSSIHVRYID